MSTPLHLNNTVTILHLHKRKAGLTVVNPNLTNSLCYTKRCEFISVNNPKSIGHMALPPSHNKQMIRN